MSTQCGSTCTTTSNDLNTCAYNVTSRKQLTSVGGKIKCPSTINKLIHVFIHRFNHFRKIRISQPFTTTAKNPGSAVTLRSNTKPAACHVFASPTPIVTNLRDPAVVGVELDDIDTATRMDSRHASEAPGRSDVGSNQHTSPGTCVSDVSSQSYMQHVASSMRSVRWVPPVQIIGCCECFRVSHVVTLFTRSSDIATL